MLGLWISSVVRFMDLRYLWFMVWFYGCVRSEIGFGSGLLQWCTRCTAFELFSFTSSKLLPISGFSPRTKNKNSQRISGTSTSQWRTLKLQRKLFIFLGGERKSEDRSLWKPRGLPHPNYISVNPRYLYTTYFVSSETRECSEALKRRTTIWDNKLKFEKILFKNYVHVLKNLRSRKL